MTGRLNTPAQLPAGSKPLQKPDNIGVGGSCDPELCLYKKSHYWFVFSTFLYFVIAVNTTISTCQIKHLPYKTVILHIVVENGRLKNPEKERKSLKTRGKVERKWVKLFRNAGIEFSRRVGAYQNYQGTKSEKTANCRQTC